MVSGLGEANLKQYCDNIHGRKINFYKYYVFIVGWVGFNDLFLTFGKTHSRSIWASSNQTSIKNVFSRDQDMLRPCGPVYETILLPLSCYWYTKVKGPSTYILNR